MQAKGIQPCIPGRKSRLEPIKYDKPLYRCRSRIEIIFGCVKDWRLVWSLRDSGEAEMGEYATLSLLPGLMLAGHEMSVNLIVMALTHMLASRHIRGSTGW